jgi:hypothetical protein
MLDFDDTRVDAMLKYNVYRHANKNCAMCVLIITVLRNFSGDESALKSVEIRQSGSDGILMSWKPHSNGLRVAIIQLSFSGMTVDANYNSPC